MTFAQSNRHCLDHPQGRDRRLDILKIHVRNITIDPAVSVRGTVSERPSETSPSAIDGHQCHAVVTRLCCDRMTDSTFTIELVQQADYRFEARFDNPALPTLVTDEPAPLGGDAGPNPARLLGTAVANCLAASLLFALRKHRNHVEPLRAVATVSVVRNAQNRLRIGRIGVDLHLEGVASEINALDRVLAQFEDFCIVTQSIRAGIEVDVRVVDRSGAALTPAVAGRRSIAA
jgi:uncharacterized OsmC-like protein